MLEPPCSVHCVYTRSLVDLAHVIGHFTEHLHGSRQANWVLLFLLFQFTMSCKSTHFISV